jgi:hypothetical protein
MGVDRDPADPADRGDVPKVLAIPGLVDREVLEERPWADRSRTAASVLSPGERPI